MLRLDAKIREELTALQKRAREKKSWEQVFLDEKQIILTVNNWLQQTHSLLLIEALKNDLRSMPVHEALASWCDPLSGLASQFPQEILNIAKIMLPEEQEDVDTHNSKPS
jgi:hypothetical protein